MVNTRKSDRKAYQVILFGRRNRRRAFTLVELLAVMSTVFLLAGVLCPAIQRAGRHAQALACRGQLRQWGVAFSTFLDERDKLILDMDTDEWDLLWRPYCDRRRSLFLCPMASRYETNANDPILMEREATGCGLGSKFTAWKLPVRTPMGAEPGLLLGSYGLNSGGLAFLDPRATRGCKAIRSNTPVFLDCVAFYTQFGARDDPPVYDGHLTSPGDMKRCCIDRHSGAVNSLFLDWSVGQIGLKELWMQTWSPWFDRHGPWTRAGGVRPEDWPQWMRAFKDY